MLKGTSPFHHRIGHRGLGGILILVVAMFVAGSVQPADARSTGEQVEQGAPPTEAPPTATKKPRKKATNTPEVTYIPPTETPTPTSTVEPSSTPTDTPSPTPTETLEPTATPTEQPTLAPAPSSTPVPITDEAASTLSLNALGILSLIAAGLGLVVLVWSIRRLRG